ncbi:MAG: hypothetical protein JWO58_2706 [Chitinophagaceae bacterium]|nr:hypothetical protein [Chitinophagaceae bacterium]
MIDRPEEYEKMDLTERNLWWYKILHEHVLTSIQKKFPLSSSSSIKILDAACGTGGLIDYLTRQGFSAVQGFDISNFAVQKCREKTKLDIARLDIREAATFYKGSLFDVIICNDALYFVSEEELPVVLQGLLGLLSPNGILIINLPAGNGFRGMHDISVGIQERWNFSKFNKHLSTSSSTPHKVDHFYWPFLLSPLIYSIRLAQRIKLHLFPSSEITSDVALPPLVLNRIFYKLTKWEYYLPFKKRIGSSLFIVIHR